MKMIHYLLCLPALLIFLAAGAQNQYEAAMQAAMEKLYQARSADAFQEAANTFDRIARKEVDKWHPHYYSAYAHLMICTQTEGGKEKDQQLDLALDLVKKAGELSPKNSEVLALEGLVHMLRIPIDPASRGAQYSGMSFSALKQAIALNPENPRAHMLLSDMQFGTAQFFGNGPEESCATLEKATGLFETFKPDSPLDPNWGREWALQSLGRCPR